ncbi:MAG TPA: ATP-binding cassette domain-containing protein [Acidimicrobiales bacterium]|nr:ATP-binding cassette domain-containing protein [Acidimicrobiales bacterium]
MDGVGAFRPDRPLFTDCSATVATGDRVGVVGPNGSGKSTLLRLVAGVDEPEVGTVRRGRNVRVGHLHQQPDLAAGDVRSAVGPSWEAAAILEHLGMGGLGGADVATLSGGQAKRVALAQVLVDDVDLLVLDEPTNHLDVDAIAWLEERLARFKGGLVLVTHDRHVLDRVATRVLELDGGRCHVHDGGYTAYLEASSRRAGQEATAEVVRRNLARAELAWLRRGAPARTRKPKARLAAARTIVEGGPGDRPSGLDLGAAAGRGPGMPRLGDKVVVLRGLGHRFDDGPPLFTGLDLDLEPGGRLGVVGPNGSGKTTLLEVIAGRLAPVEGEVDRGTTVRLGYYHQRGADLDPDLRVRDAVAGRAGQPTWDQVRLLERFRFDADGQWAPVATLSGGERRRLQLLLVLAAMPNVLLLDEPTNDLDLDTLRALEDHLDDWPGTLVVVSHDRALLERTVEDVLVLDGAGHAGMAPGGYAGYEAARRTRAARTGTGRGLRPTAPGREGEAAGGPSAPGGTPSAGGVSAGGPSAPGGTPSAGGVSAGGPPAPGSERSTGGGAGRPVVPSAAGGAGSPGSAAARRARRRSPSTLRRLLGNAEREMAEVAAERDRLERELADAGADHVARARTAEALAAAQARLGEAEERWLELAEELGA